MAKLLVEQEDGKQFLIEVTETGNYAGIVLWDDRTDGPLPQDAMGPNLHGWIRSGAHLVFDTHKLASHQGRQDPDNK